MRPHAELMVEARYIAALTCQQVEVILAEVEALDRTGVSDHACRLAHRRN